MRFIFVRRNIFPWFRFFGTFSIDPPLSMQDNKNEPDIPRGVAADSIAAFIAIAAVSSLAALVSLITAGAPVYWVAAVSVAVVFQAAALLMLYRNVVRKRADSSSIRSAHPDEIFDAETDERLQMLEEAGRFFGAAISPEDVFPLLSERAREIVHFDSLTVFAAEEDELVRMYSGGKAPGPSDASSPDAVRETALRAFHSGNVAVSGEYADHIPGSRSEFGSVAALPLVRDANVFAVIAFCSVPAEAFLAREKILLEAVGERISPLVAGAMAYGRQLSNSLTDPVTGLPNERAFRLVLEGRVAEAQRFKDERPLIVLAIDLRGFSALNSSHGHTTGDRALEFAGSVIRTELRKMDTLARTSNDEFLAVLPSAGDETASEILARISEAISSRRFPLTDDPEFTLELNAGYAGFARDGGSAEELIKAARLRRDRSKINKSNQVILFPTQYSN
jgi:diguanylate cyclase (GGDEF)-like protein